MLSGGGGRGGMEKFDEQVAGTLLWLGNLGSRDPIGHYGFLNNSINLFIVCVYYRRRVLITIRSQLDVT